MSQNNSSDPCPHVDKLIKRYYLPTMYVIIFSVGLVGNVTSIIVYMVKMRPWKSCSFIMLNLAVADLLYVFSLPFLAYYYIKEDIWTMGDFMCIFVRLSFHFNLYGSILFLTCLSIFRYVVVVYPLKADIHRKTWGCVACLVVWTISAVEILPMLTIFKEEQNDNKTVCLDFASNNPVRDVWWYSWVLTIMGYLAPLAVVSFCYFRIVKALAKGPHTHSLHRMRARKLTVVILVVFIVCFMPLHILRLVRIGSRWWITSCEVLNWVNAAYIISRPVAGLNTFFNLALYTLAGDRFRQALVNMFCNKCWVSKIKSHLSIAVVTVAAIISSHGKPRSTDTSEGTESSRQPVEQENC